MTDTTLKEKLNSLEDELVARVKEIEAEQIALRDERWQLMNFLKSIDHDKYTKKVSKKK